MTGNARYFLAFRVLFNCRFYYPIFTVLFLDLGLTLSDFATLNVVWALTIVLLEVPSGALADQIGRQKLMLLASGLMIAEMALLCLMPVGNREVVFWLFVLNRLCSGAAEACASGADEALAYESLPEDGRTARWAELLKILSQVMAVGFIFSSILGGLCYDHELMNRFFGVLGFPALERSVTLKIPLILNLLTALTCLAVCLKMREIPCAFCPVPASSSKAAHVLGEAWSSIRKTGIWICRNAPVFQLLLLGVVFDSIIRLFLTITSEFYRLLGIEERWFGMISTGVSLLGLAMAGWMPLSVARFSRHTLFIGLAAFVLLGLHFAAQPAAGWWGILGILPLFIGMRFLQFFLSHYLNEWVPSEQRATALSFRGLSMNLAYGAMTLLFGWHTAWLKNGALSTGATAADNSAIFAASLQIWPLWFIGTLAAALLLMMIQSSFNKGAER